MGYLNKVIGPLENEDNRGLSENVEEGPFKIKARGFFVGNVED